MPRVSVIMASYNHEQFVGRAIQSVLDQTFHDLELVITDDASPDETANVIRAFDDPRIDLEQFEHNRQDSARNRCLARATGEYVAILNSDDEFHPGKLEAQVAWLDAHPETGAVFSQVRFIDESGRDLTGVSHWYAEKFTSQNRSRFEWLRRFFDAGNCLCITTAMIRRELIDDVGGFNPILAQLSDLDLWIRLCLRTDIHILPETLTDMRLLDGEANASGRRPETFRRSRYESYLLLWHYSSRPAMSQLTRIFPELKTVTESPPESIVLYQLAQYAIEFESQPHQFFGMELLRELAENDQYRSEIEAYTSAPLIADFMRLSGKTGPLSAIADATVEMYWPVNGQLRADRKSTATVPVGFRHTTRLSCPEGPAGMRRLRIDPGNRSGVVSIHSITVRQSGNGEVMRTIAGRELRGRAHVCGTARRLRSKNSLQLLSTGPDPQVLLPPIPAASGQPIEVEVDIEIGADIESVGQHVSAQNIRQAIRLRASFVKQWLKRGMARIWPSVIQR